MVLILPRLTASNTGDNGACMECTAVVSKAKRASESDLPPDSSKTRKIVEILREIDSRSDGEDRTIIFSQFTSMLDIIEPFLEAEGIRYVRCECLVLRFVATKRLALSDADDGTMNKAQRELALDAIKKENGRTRVILISFKAGSTGERTPFC